MVQHLRQSGDLLVDDTAYGDVALQLGANAMRSFAVGKCLALLHRFDSTALYFLCGEPRTFAVGTCVVLPTYQHFTSGQSCNPYFSCGCRFALLAYCRTWQ